MKTLAIDLETFSKTDIMKCGVYKYVECPEFEILMMAYSIDGGPVKLLDFKLNRFEHESNHVPGPSHANTIARMLLAKAENVVALKTAYNANFERTCLAKYFDIPMPPEQWECTQVKAAMCGLPMNLDGVAKALKLVEQKDPRGKQLIRYFSIPCKPTKANGFRERNLPIADIEKWIVEILENDTINYHDRGTYKPLREYAEKTNAMWAEFKAYCVQDVKTEIAIRDKISFFQVPPYEKDLWNLDQKINDRGVLVDTSFVRSAIHISAEHTRILVDRATELTGLNNPNSAAQLREWLEQETGEDVPKLRKEDVTNLLEKLKGEFTVRHSLDEEDYDITFTAVNKIQNEKTNVIVEEVLKIRQQMSKSSVKKYTAMENAVCADGRVRGMLQFYGANRTGRWAGRFVQLQNLPQNHLADLDLARQTVKSTDAETVQMLFGNVPDTLSQLIRTAFIVPADNRFIVADFSAIEARVIAWLAGEKWRLDVFNSHGKIYEASAAQMFKVPIEQVTKGSELRQKSKIAELALGYQGNVGALLTMGAIKMGLTEDELQPLVDAWRKANPAIVKLWYKMQEIAIEAVKNPGRAVKYLFGPFKECSIVFCVKHGTLWMNLPSGRLLAYVRPKLVAGKFGEALQYEGLNQDTKQWQHIDTYGGKLVENCVQAIARDCLAVSMLNIKDAGYSIVMSIHDENVLEVPDGFGSTEEVNEIMGRPISWAPGLPLRAESYETIYYKKD